MSKRWYEVAKARMAAANPPIKVKDIAEVLDMTPSGAGHYLLGRREPSIEQLKLIAGRIGISMSEMCGEDPYFIVDEDEREAINILRQLPEDSVKRALQILAVLKDNNETRKRGD